VSEPRDSIEGAITDIRAGEILLPKTLAEQCWNNSAERAIAILRKYATGHGLLQPVPGKPEEKK
jgi:hypothetical protein